MRKMASLWQTVVISLAVLAGATIGVAATPAGAASPHPRLTSMSAHLGSVRGGSTVTIHGKNLRDLTKVTFGSTRAKVLTRSATAVKVRTPKLSARSVYVRVYTHHGTTARNAHSTFRFVGAPVVSGLVPNFGPNDGGNHVTLRGGNFLGVTKVTVGGVKAPKVVVTSSGLLSILMPKLAAGSHTIRVYGAFGASTVGKASTYRYIQKPIVTGVRAVDGDAYASMNVEITGRYLTGAIVAYFNTLPTPVQTKKIDTDTRVYVQVPRHSPGLVHVTIRTAGGRSTATSADLLRLTGDITESWSNADQPYGAASAVSCASGTYCVVAEKDGDVWTFDPATAVLGADTPAISPSTTSARGTSVTCTKNRFCLVASASQALAATSSDGLTWTATPAPHAALRSVSCASSTFCLGASGSVEVYNGSNWTVVTGGPASNAEAVSCASATFCVVVAAGAVWTYRPGVSKPWTSTTTLKPTSSVDPQAVSCWSANGCLLVDQSGAATVWDGSSWSAPETLLTGPTAVSCAPAGHCTTIDSHGYSRTYYAQEWSARQLLHTGPALSCYGIDLCMAVDADSVSQSDHFDTGTGD
jgi:hypothetical protein